MISKSQILLATNNWIRRL